MSVTYFMVRREGVAGTVYWYGPEDNWGRTWGPINTAQQIASARFPSRLAAERALRHVFGSLAQAKRDGCKIFALKGAS